MKYDRTEYLTQKANSLVEQIMDELNIEDHPSEEEWNAICHRLAEVAVNIRSCVMVYCYWDCPRYKREGGDCTLMRHGDCPMRQIHNGKVDIKEKQND